MQLPVTQICAALNQAQAAIKMGLAFVPGNNPDEKAASLLAVVEPPLKAELDALQVPAMVEAIALKSLEWIVTAEVKAAS